MNALPVALCTFLLASSPLAHAIQPAGAPIPSHAALSESDIVERGGTVDGVDAARQALLVDGVPYAIPRGSVRIHLAGNRVSTSLADLKRGMQVRFTSQKAYGTHQVQVREIWVTGARAH
jgi:hypothetical protein